jgi:hydroxymethylpyrimidine pyrophosphatase-like HAD family hydrolase
MKLSFRILSTDFDGTMHSDFEDPPVARKLEALIGELQGMGLTWVINTGRDLSSLMETLGRARLSIWPDYVVTVEREIYRRDDGHYVGVDHWNTACTEAHARLFERVKPVLPQLLEWIHGRFEATVYEDAWSPFCLIAGNNGDADLIHARLEEFSREIEGLAVMRNDVYARFSHCGFHKGTALTEVARLLNVPLSQIIAAGDHFNDLPMLCSTRAGYCIAPSNAIPEVKEKVRRLNGFVSGAPHGYGVAEGIELFRSAGVSARTAEQGFDNPSGAPEARLSKP